MSAGGVDLRLPPLHRAQQEVALSHHRHRVVAAGRRLGKTWLGIRLILESLFAGRRAWWVAPTYSIGGIAWRQIVQVIRFAPAGLFRRSETERTIRSATRGSAAFRSGDRPENLRGEGLDLVVMDEADFQPEETWTQVLRPSLADRGGRSLLISTPNVEGGWFHRLHERGRAGDPEIAAMHFPSSMNPYLPAGEIEAARRDMPEIDFRREFMAEFVSVAGARIQRGWLRYADAPPEGLEITLGVDLAISERTTADWTALVVLGRAADGIVYVLDAVRARMPFHDQIGLVQSLAGKWHPSTVAVEATTYQMALVQELLRTTTLPVRPVQPDRDKIARFARLEVRYQQGLVRHTPELPPEFEREVLSFPVGDHDDFCDAAAHAFAALRELGGETAGYQARPQGGGLAAVIARGRSTFPAHRRLTSGR